MGESQRRGNSLCKSKEVLEEHGSAWLERCGPRLGACRRRPSQSMLKALDSGLLVEQGEDTAGVQAGAQHAETHIIVTLSLAEA